MLIVPIEEAQPKMTLAADVFHPAQPDQILLKRGYTLDPHVIRKLADFGVLAIYVQYPDLKELDQQLAPALSPERMRIYSQVKATISAIQKKTKPTVGFSDYYLAVRGLILTLFEQGQYPLYLEQIALRNGSENAVAHATAVSHLSLLLGIKLQSYLIDQRKRLPATHATEVVNLGIAGMLHDIGKCRLPDDLPYYSATHPPEDPAHIEAWQSHPRIGYEMIRGGVETTASVAVLHHHQRFDGTGFPPRTRPHGGAMNYEGSAIHIFARILAAADVFDRLTHTESGDKATRTPTIRVLHELHTCYASWLDPAVINALDQVVPPFPPGSKVRLTDNTMAVITGLNARDPYHPIVRRLKADRWSLEETAINLAAPDTAQIASIDGVEVQPFLPAAVA